MTRPLIPAFTEEGLLYLNSESLVRFETNDYSAGRTTNLWWHYAAEAAKGAQHFLQFIPQSDHIGDGPHRGRANHCATYREVPQ